MTTDRTERPLENIVRWALELGLSTGHADTEEQLLSELGDQIKELQRKYFELIFAVATKHPGKSRHETALMYIELAEMPNNNPAHCAPPNEQAKERAQ